MDATLRSGRSDDKRQVSGIYASLFKSAVMGMPDAEDPTKTEACAALKSGRGASKAELRMVRETGLEPV